MFNNKKKYIHIIFLTIIILCFISFSIQAVGVRPLVVDLDMRPGETKNFELILIPSQRQETVQLSLYHPEQQLTGGLSYQKGDPEHHPATNWINIENNKVTVPPGQETKVSGEVNVPYDAGGSHTAIIMVEPVVEDTETGITFQIRYAVRVNINVARTGIRESIEIMDFDLTADDEGYPVVSAHLKNDSPLLYNAAAEVTVRDEGRQLLERTSLRSEIAKQSGRDETTIYPGSEVVFKGPVNEQLFPGTYDVQLYLYYANGRQVIRRKTVEVEDEFIDMERLEFIKVEPERISEEIRAGGALTEAINIRNRTGDRLFIKVGAQEIKPDYSQNLFDEFEVNLRGNSEFELNQRRSNRSVLIIRSPRDIEKGGYYGRILIDAFNKDGEILEQREIDLDIMIGEDHEYKAEIMDFTGLKEEDEIILSATVNNKSKIHISPEARVYLRDENQEIKHTLNLELAEGVKRILPEETGYLIKSTTGIKEGEYIAEIYLYYAGQEIAKSELPLEIEKNREE